MPACSQLAEIRNAWLHACGCRKHEMVRARRVEASPAILFLRSLAPQAAHAHRTNRLPPATDPCLLPTCFCRGGPARGSAVSLAAGEQAWGKTSIECRMTHFDPSFRLCTSCHLTEYTSCSFLASVSASSDSTKLAIITFILDSLRQPSSQTRLGQGATCYSTFCRVKVRLQVRSFLWRKGLDFHRHLRAVGGILFDCGKKGRKTSSRTIASPPR